MGGIVWILSVQHANRMRRRENYCQLIDDTQKPKYPLVHGHLSFGIGYKQYFLIGKHFNLWNLRFFSSNALEIYSPRVIIKYVLF